MNVEKEDIMVTIPTHTYLDYYRMKNDHTCIECSKKGSVTCTIENRILSAVCSSCKFNMRILEDTYITYDENARRSKEAYEKSTDEILRAKFDHIFEYDSSSNLEKLRNQYLKDKKEYDELYIQWQTLDPNHSQLTEHRDTLIAALKTLKTNASTSQDQDRLYEQLNDVLNDLHKVEYTTLYNEVARTPIYDLEIRTLDNVSKPFVYKKMDKVPLPP